MQCIVEAAKRTLALQGPVRSALAIIIVRNARPDNIRREGYRDADRHWEQRPNPAELARETFGRFQITDVTDLSPAEIHEIDENTEYKQSFSRTTV